MKFGDNLHSGLGGDILYVILPGRLLPSLFKEALAIRRIFSLVDMITKTKFSNRPYAFKIGLFR